MKKVLSLAIAAALVAPVAAMADATIYGKVRQGIDYVDIDQEGDNDIDEFQINDKTSRLGVKGSEDLGNGLKAIYKIEYGVRISTSDRGDGEIDSGDGTLSARNAYVGLAGDSWGTFLVGRHDTPLKMSTGRLDYFSDTSADNNGGQINRTFPDGTTAMGYTENLTDRRLDGTLVYISPSFSGFTLAGAIAPGEVSDNNVNESNGIADVYSIAGMYSNAGLYVSAAYEAADGDLVNELSRPPLNDADDLTQWRVGAGWDAGNWKIAGVYENEQIDSSGAGDDIRDADKWVVSGGYKFGNGMAKAKYFSYDDDKNDSATHDGFAIGYDYNFSKRTQLSALYVDTTFDDQPGGDDDIDVSVIGVQMNHNF